jgi:hypothetical protein
MVAPAVFDPRRRAIVCVLHTGRESRPPQDSVAGSALIADIVNGDSDRLRWLTAEALSYLAWLARFCEARGLTEDEA